MIKQEVNFNPCFCWNLKDGCITSGIWTMIYSIIQMCIFSWQSYVIKWERDKTANRRLPFYGVYENYDYRYLGPDWTKFYVAPEERFFTGLFVIQILCLISAFFLLFASVALIYGVHTSSKHLIWPWFPCIVASILCSMAYCVTWWAWGVENYWLILTVIESFSVLVNLYVLLCVIIQYRRVLRHHEDYAEEQKVPVVVWDDHNQNDNFASTRLKRLSDFVGYPLDQAQKHEHLWPQESSQVKHPRQQLEEAAAVDSMETIPMETVLDGPMKVHDAEKNNVLSNTRTGINGAERSSSVDALTTQLAEKTRRSMRSAKSKESLCSKHRRRSHSHHRHDSEEDSDEKRSMGDSRSRFSDTDTGYSESSRRSRHKHRHRSTDERENLHKHGKHRRVRDVKREDKERSDKKSSATSSPSPSQPYHGVPGISAYGIPVYPSSYSVPYNPAFAGSCDLPNIRGDPLFGMPHLFSGYPVSQAFAASAMHPQTQQPVISALREVQLPPSGSVLYTDLGGAQQQQFVIPSSQQQPHKFQINSEIQISYGDHAEDPRQSDQQNNQAQQRMLPDIEGSALSPAVDESEHEKSARSASGSGDSKGTGATAV
uniref:MARVEL domain-containing protein n=1 Tax=Trichuris muris TaxID=70415 RepID=A0A5S6QJ09_TRIMR